MRHGKSSALLASIFTVFDQSLVLKSFQNDSVAPCCHGVSRACWRTIVAASSADLQILRSFYNIPGRLLEKPLVENIDQEICFCELNVAFFALERVFWASMYNRTLLYTDVDLVEI